MGERKKGEGGQMNFKKALVAFINSLFSRPCECVDSSSELFHICGEGRRLYSVSGPRTMIMKRDSVSLLMCLCRCVFISAFMRGHATSVMSCGLCVCETAWMQNGVVIIRGY